MATSGIYLDCLLCMCCFLCINVLVIKGCHTCFRTSCQESLPMRSVIFVSILKYSSFCHAFLIYMLVWLSMLSDLHNCWKFDTFDILLNMNIVIFSLLNVEKLKKLCRFSLCLGLETCFSIYFKAMDISVSFLGCYVVDH